MACSFFAACPSRLSKAFWACWSPDLPGPRFDVRGSYELTDDRQAWLFGLSAGVLGGAYGMNGPPLVVYGALRRWSPEHFRATLQGYFLPASVIGMIGYWAAGLWTPSVSRYYCGRSRHRSWRLPWAV